MIETLTIITLSVLFLIFFRPGKTPPLDNPLVIQRPGQYHMTLAPKLNLAQPFIEAIAKRLADDNDINASSATLYFEVSDKQVVAHGDTFYLLALTRRERMLYCQAVSPVGADLSNNFDTIRQAAATVLSGVLVVAGNESEDECLLAAVGEVAQRRGIGIKLIKAGSVCLPINNPG